MSEFDNVTAPPPPPSGDAPQEDRTIALITHLSGIVAGFVVPLIMWLINKDKPEKSWLTDQSKESLNFQITIVIALVIAIILMTVTLGLLFFLPALVGITNIVFCILGGVASNKGESYRYPFALRLIK
ncbi:hypothetical protein CSC74_05310 [Pseudoxanthomonas yeongjuensis]|uniref:DUF4870 domain-containing protein n=1 Tax=Pseudoxanthomonas yeongjuensis TaxID=377616 RepID=UPI001390F8EA|nr:DUF4870 domain-containing protein [Pseudoxanthomonas yeongjuensis]KAF1718294.1 hypothetical protein CSC74_05310 [Pseudoxanthomonas yeongjuensis]